MRLQRRIENIVESCLWNVRFFTFIPVLFGVISVITLFLLGSYEIVHGLMAVLSSPAHAGEAVKEVAEQAHKVKDPVKLALAGIIGGIDLYLIGVVLLLFSFGIYELFISKIDVARGSNQDVQILEIKSLDELKDKILKVIIMVLIVSFFKEVIQMELTGYLDILYLAISILLVSASGYLMHASGHHSAAHATEHAGHEIHSEEHH